MKTTEALFLGRVSRAAEGTRGRGVGEATAGAVGSRSTVSGRTASGEGRKSGPQSERLPQPTARALCVRMSSTQVSSGDFESGYKFECDRKIVFFKLMTSSQS